MEKIKGVSLSAIEQAKASLKPAKNYNYPIQAPILHPSVVPPKMDAKALPVAMDSSYNYANSSAFGYGDGYGFIGFPGYPYLAQLSTRAEYRMFAQAISSQLTREWIVLNSSDTAGDETREKITQLTQDITELGLKECIGLMAEHDSYYGRAQILHNITGHDLEKPLILDPRTIKKQEFKPGTSIKKYYQIKAVEAMWTTPQAYNATDPSKPDFYIPIGWYMVGVPVHATRLQTVITRPLTDMLKPAFNFGGMSQSQLAEPYVDNWLRTRQSVSDLISNFSIVKLGTKMDQVLQGNDNGANLIRRAELFTLHRNNQGVFLHDKETEELSMDNVPLGGLDALQAQSQEQLCSVSHTPSVILLGVAPSGFGNIAEGEIRAYYDWVASIQELYWRAPIETVIQILQLIRYGSIDADIVVTFEPLYQMTPKELAEIRTADAATDASYTDRQILSTEEVREKLARNPVSGYQGLDVSDLPESDNGEEGQELENEDVP